MVRHKIVLFQDFGHFFSGHLGSGKKTTTSAGAHSEEDDAGAARAGDPGEAERHQRLRVPDSML